MKNIEITYACGCTQTVPGPGNDLLIEMQRQRALETVCRKCKMDRIMDQQREFQSGRGGNCPGCGE